MNHAQKYTLPLNIHQLFYFFAFYLKNDNNLLIMILIAALSLTIPVETFFPNAKEKQLRVEEHRVYDDLAEAGHEKGIFFVMEGESKPIAVMKVFVLEERLREFERELKALEELQRLKLRYFHPIKLLNSSQNEELGILLEEVAPGKTLNHYLKEISSLPTGPKRMELLQEYKEALSKTAQAISELHHKKRSFLSTMQLSPYYAEKFAHLTEEALPGPYGYIHGDLHPGNIFYDSLTKKVTFIDLSADISPQAGGPIASDIAYFLFTEEAFASYYGLTALERVDLQQTFLDSYKKEGALPSDNTLAFYKELFFEEFSQNLEPITEQSRFIRSYAHNQKNL